MRSGNLQRAMAMAASTSRASTTADETASEPPTSLKQALGIKGWLLVTTQGPIDTLADEVVAMARQLGTPSGRDGGKIAWPVTPSAGIGTFSQTSHAAPFHTDAQYHARPERFMLLACARPANRGGESRILTAANLLADLADAGFGDADMRMLRAPIWSWTVPAVFQQSTLPQRSPPRPILLPDGGVRWRYDNLVCANSDQQHLAAAFHRAIEASKRASTIRLQPGQILVCDNRRALHARTAFDDPNRLLFRVRVS